MLILRISQKEVTQRERCVPPGAEADQRVWPGAWPERPGLTWPEAPGAGLALLCPPWERLLPLGPDADALDPGPLLLAEVEPPVPTVLEELPPPAELPPAPRVLAETPLPALALPPVPTVLEEDPPVPPAVLPPVPTVLLLSARRRPVLPSE